MKERKGRGGEPPPRLKSVEGGSRVSWNQPRGDRRGERGRGRGVADSLAVKYGVKGSIIDYTDFLCRKKP